MFVTPAAAAAWVEETQTHRSTLSVGDWVRTTNGTSRLGRVQRIEWHRGASRPVFFIVADGKPVSRRYYAGDLERVSSATWHPRTDPWY